MKSKTFGIVLAFVVAGQLALLPKAVAKNTEISGNFHKHRGQSSFKLMRNPILELSADTEPYYVIASKNGAIVPILQSKDFDPDKLSTAASHTKLLTAYAALSAMKENPGLSTPENSARLRKALLHSDSVAAEQLAIAVSADHTKVSALLLLQETAKTLGVSDQFIPANASGKPDWILKAPRQDSMASANAIASVAIKLAQEYPDELRKIYQTVDMTDKPTNNLFYPILKRGDIPDPNVFMFCKTATDRFQSRSTEVILKVGDVTYSMLLRHLINDPKPSIAIAATLVLKVLDHEDIQAPALREQLQAIASGKVESHYVGPALPQLASAGTKIHRKRHPRFMAESAVPQ